MWKKHLKESNTQNISPRSSTKLGRHEAMGLPTNTSMVLDN